MAEPFPISDATPVASEAAPAPAPTPTPIENGTPATADVEMKDEIPAVQTPTHNNTTAATIPTPAAVPTPSRNSPLPTQSTSAPISASPHGSSTRAYLNQNVTPYLLDAMKHLVTGEHDKPLKFLSEYLAKESAKHEGT
ncbi:hypothetical protein K491DRAFT_709605 [Lophiostoma macrostomum CBS 122681]|uniref:Uncharacterized protein n=1 Tax=Lophiostoma macrostomum CBS 122681 TaxID=1314788 RepID=A0A6A6TVE8_9PLEO|nr:hypothetical protein K491DRAFT_709605 [Lophiostoma macrostomum CBS 122681]